MRKLKLLLVGLAVAAAGCADELNVVNQNNADTERALLRPGDVENLIAASYSTMWANSQASGLKAQLVTFGMESYSNLANFGMGSRSAIPRPSIDNSRNNNAAGDNRGAFIGLHRAARAAALGLDRVQRPGFTFFPTSVSQNNRAIAFANFTIGISVGQIALMYDSGAAVSEADDPDPTAAPIPLLGYAALMQYALGRLDSALAYATAARFGATTVPAAWLSAAADVSVAQFRAQIQGWKARLRAGVARDPAERAAVDWASVQADADSFLVAYPTGGFVMSRASTSPFGFGFLITMHQSNGINWHQVFGLVAGMAGDQAGFDNWLGTAPLLRTNYTVVSPDLRWPQGATRTAQQAAPGLYYTNRAVGHDWFGDTYGNSQYRMTRWLQLRNDVSAGATTTFLPMPSAEMRLLAAEALYRAGNYAAAAARVDASRVGVGGLPAAPTDAVTLVSGGASCVPRIPVAPFTVSACGNLWEALKWEKRMETSFTVFGAWYTDGRGWGDLPQGTAPHWPVPYDEMDARAQSFYAMQGTGAPGTYGF